MQSKRVFWATSLILPAFFASGCTSTSVDLGTPLHEQVIRADQKNLRLEQDAPKHLSLSIEDALDKAVQENLDARVSALEYLIARGDVTLDQLKALPSMQYTLGRTGRSKESASSSLSLATGQQSLEPSISSQRYHNTMDANFNWNLIDAASALVEAQTSKDRAAIQKERHDKVIQNIHRDVYSAYWRAAASVKTDAQTKSLLKQASNIIRKIDQAAREKLISGTAAQEKKAPLLDMIARLTSLQEESKLARIELKSLLNLPQGTTLTLTSQPDLPSKTIHALIEDDIEVLELAALRNRPEMREAFLDRNISIRNTKQELIKTLPGAELFLGFSRDDNRFLSNDEWRSYSASLVQSVTDIITMPGRYISAQKNEKLSEARRVTLAAALLAQVHIARHGLKQAQELYAIGEKEHKAARKQSFAASKKANAGHLSKSEALLTRMQAHEKYLESGQRFATLQDSYATFVNTLGQPVNTDFSFDILKKEAS